MNFQEKIFESTARARARAEAAKRVELLKGSFATLSVAGRELNQVARRHTVRFVKENSTIAADAGKDLSALARATYKTLVDRAAPKPKTRKASPGRKRPAARKTA